MRQRTHEGFLRHKNFMWAQVATGLCVGVIALYWFVALRLNEPPSGGSWLGYLLGTMGAAQIVWPVGVGDLDGVGFAVQPA